MQSPSPSFTKSCTLGLFALALSASSSAALSGSSHDLGLIPFPIAARNSAQEMEPLVPVYVQSVDVALSDKSLLLGYRENSPTQDGFWNAEFLLNDENDFALNARLMRVGQVVGTPLRLGVGVGTYAAFYDDSGEKLYALALCASAQYDLPTKPPTTASIEVALAPDITTFKDGEDLLDIALRLEVQVSRKAVAFLGVRLLDANTTSDSTFTHALQVGVRLSL